MTDSSFITKANETGVLCQTAHLTDDWRQSEDLLFLDKTDSNMGSILQKSNQLAKSQNEQNNCSRISVLSVTTLHETDPICQLFYN